jgi:hypothetical protein
MAAASSAILRPGWHPTRKHIEVTTRMIAAMTSARASVLPKRVVAIGLSLTGLLAVDDARAQPEWFEVVARGPTIQASAGMSRAGYRLMGDLGGQSAGIRSFSFGRWLLSWDVIASARGGVLANTEPYLSLFGVSAAAWVEPVYRLLDSGWSPAVSARLGDDAVIMWHPGVSLGELHQLNDMDGVGGVFARGLIRAGGGASFLDGTRSFLLQAFAQEFFQSHGANADAKAFTEVGISARFDWTRGLSAALEGSTGTTLSLDDAALHRTYRTSRIGAAGNVRKIFGNGTWLALFVSLKRDSDRVTYEATNTTFDTASPADFTLGAAFGFSLWGPR